MDNFSYDTALLRSSRLVPPAGGISGRNESLRQDTTDLPVVACPPPMDHQLTPTAQPTAVKDSVFQFTQAIVFCINQSIIQLMKYKINVYHVFLARKCLLNEPAPSTMKEGVPEITQYLEYTLGKYVATDL